MTIEVKIGPITFLSTFDELEKMTSACHKAEIKCLEDAHELHKKATEAFEDGDITEHNLCMTYADNEESVMEVAHRWNNQFADALMAILNEE